MNKIAGLLIFICAFFTALYFILTDKKVSNKYLSDTSSVKRKFLTAVTIIIAFFSNSEASSVKEISETNHNTTQVIEKNVLNEMEQTEEWKGMEKKWINLRYEILNLKSLNHESMDEEMKKHEEEMNNYIGALLSKGYISKNVADILNYIYGELIFHRLRIVEGATCYAGYGGFLQDHREHVLNRIKLLSEVSSKGVLSEKVMIETKLNIARDIEVFYISRKMPYNLIEYDEQVKRFEESKEKMQKKDLMPEDDILTASKIITKLNMLPQNSNILKKIKFEYFNKDYSWKRYKIMWKDISKEDNKTFTQEELDEYLADIRQKCEFIKWRAFRSSLFSHKVNMIIDMLYRNRIYNKHGYYKGVEKYSIDQYNIPEELINLRKTASDDFEKCLPEIEKNSLESQQMGKIKTRLANDIEVISSIYEYCELKTDNKQKEYEDKNKEIISRFRNNEIQNNIIISEETKEILDVIENIYKENNEIK